jgi:hypothetical protein
MSTLEQPVTEVTQTLLYGPEGEARGVYGNCLQAAVASALGLDLDAVPHFAAFAWWEPAARLWLRGRGLDWRAVDGIPAGRSIVVGSTVRATGDHAVVGDDGKVAWDPHPSRAGLAEVKRSYVLEAWLASGPGGCACCGREPS